MSKMLSKKNKMRNKKVTDKLIESLENEVYIDKNKNLPEIQNKQKWHTKLYLLLLNFIEGDLNKLDPKLALHYQNTPFKEITITRAVFKNKTASKRMIDLFGYYAFKEAWPELKKDYIQEDEEKKKIIVAEVPEESLPFHHMPAEEKPIVPKKPSSKAPRYLLYSLLGISIIGLIIKFGIPSTSTESVPDLAPVCDCNIEPATTDLDILDSVQYEKIIQLSNDDIPIEEIRHLVNSPKIRDMSSQILEQESKTFIEKMTNNFPEKYDTIFMELLFYQTYFCAMDKMYCKDNSLVDSVRSKFMSANYHQYHLTVRELLNQHKQNPIIITIKDPIISIPPVEQKETFQLVGSNFGALSTLKKDIIESTSLEYSANAETNYKISFESSSKIVQDEDPLFYFSPEGRLVILINGVRLCENLEGDQYKLAGVHSPGNRLHQTKQSLEKQINKIITKNHLKIAEIIKECIHARH